MNDDTLTASSVIHVDNALVEDVSTGNSRTGFILISYAKEGENEMVFIELLQLNVGWETILMNQQGDPISLCLVRKGMFVNAAFSSMMTASIPPQAKALRIIALIPNQVSQITKDRIVSVDTRNNILYAGNPNDPEDQVQFYINSSTILLDKNGNPIYATDLQPGQMIEVEHSAPQNSNPFTMAIRIQIT